ncbi:hypothetical protein niasHS_001762 [Heterodera schachtii]|uniref:Uncharacterized protein n=1 Tax=Heterodera schachtii TaxID=97005 RepID=A0ABD2K8W3_HETSC
MSESANVPIIISDDKSGVDEAEKNELPKEQKAVNSAQRPYAPILTPFPRAHVQVIRPEHVDLFRKKTKEEREAKAKKDAEEKEKRDAEVKAKKDTEEKEKRDAEEKAKKEAEAKAKKDDKEKAEKEREETEKQSGEKSRKSKKRKNKKLSESEKSEERKEAEGNADGQKEPLSAEWQWAIDEVQRLCVDKDAEDKSKRETEEKAKRDAAEKMRRENEEKGRMEAVAKAKKDKKDNEGKKDPIGSYIAYYVDPWAEESIEGSPEEARKKFENADTSLDARPRMGSAGQRFARNLMRPVENNIIKNPGIPPEGRGKWGDNKSEDGRWTGPSTGFVNRWHIPRKRPLDVSPVRTLTTEAKVEKVRGVLFECTHILRDVMNEMAKKKKEVIEEKQDENRKEAEEEEKQKK